MSVAMPTMGDYQIAMQNPGVSLLDGDLRRGTTMTDPMGLPRVVSGGFALTYQMQTSSGRFAVRCFHRHSPDLALRYRAIQPVIRRWPELFVPVEYVERGIRVTGQAYPLIKMPWVDGVQLGTSLRKDRSRARLDGLEAQLVGIQAELERAGVSHGDLQHGNILVSPDERVRLIDYDGMFVPALDGLGAAEAGHVNYQHPLRSNQFNRQLDRFPTMALIVALRALRTDPTLWDRYSNDDNILFTRRDLVDPGRSELFAHLRTMTGVAPLAERLARIAAAPFESIPTVEQFVSGEFTAIARSSTATRPAIRSQYAVAEGSNRETLLGLEGSVVTVVGRIVDYKIGMARNGQPFAFLNFGDFRQGTFTLVLWSEAMSGREAEIRSLKGAIVSVTGLVSTYESVTRRPQMIIDSIPAIQRIDEANARLLLASSAEPVTAGAGLARSAVRVPAGAFEPLESLGIDPRAAASWGEPLGPPPVRQPTVPPASPKPAPASVPGVNTPRARRPAPPPAAPVAVPVSRPAPVATTKPAAQPPTPSPASGVAAAPSLGSIPSSPAAPHPPTLESSQPSWRAGLAVAVLVIVAAAVWFLVQQS